MPTCTSAPRITTQMKVPMPEGRSAPDQIRTAASVQWPSHQASQADSPAPPVRPVGASWDMRHGLIQARGHILARSLVDDHRQHLRPSCRRRPAGFHPVDYLGRYAAPSIRSRIHNGCPASAHLVPTPGTLLTSPDPQAAERGGARAWPAAATAGRPDRRADPGHAWVTMVIRCPLRPMRHCAGLRRGL